MIHVFIFCDSCSWVPCYFLSNPPAPAHSLLFQHLLHIWSLSKSDCMILRSIFSHRGQLRDSYTTITKDENIYWCLRRQHNALRAGGCKLLNRMMMCKFFSFCLTIIFFHLVLDFRRQNKYNLPWSSNLKSLHPPALNALCVLLEHQYMFSPFVIVMPSIVLSVKRWISKSYSQCWKGFKYAEDGGKAKNVQELEDFSEEQQAVELLRTNKGLMNNYHKI